jgi:hypothetical protein
VPKGGSTSSGAIKPRPRTAPAADEGPAAKPGRGGRLSRRNGAAPAEAPPEPKGAASPDVIDLPVGRPPADAPTGRTPAGAPTRRDPADAPTGRTPAGAPTRRDPADAPIRRRPAGEPARRKPADAPDGRTPAGAPAPPRRSRTDEPARRSPADAPDGRTPARPRRAPADEPSRQAPADAPDAPDTSDAPDEQAEKRRRSRRSRRRDSDSKRRRQSTTARARSLTPAERRAELVAAAAAVASGVPTMAERKPVSRRRIMVRRTVALVAIAALPASISAMVMADGQGTPLSQADAKFMSAELLTADQRVRNQLVHLGERGTAPARGRTRDALAATRSFEIVLRGTGGRRADQLRRALRLETRWLGAVGSTLANPRSELRDELLTRDAALHDALAALPQSGRRGVNGARQLIAYARSRERAKPGREAVAAAGASTP